MEPFSADTLNPENLKLLEEYISSMPDGKKKRGLIEKLQAVLKYYRTHKIDSYFPDSGPFRRELYKKHVDFFAAGATYDERLLMAANQVGKSKAGAYEITLHATGRYPTWWKGRRFNKPVKIWAGGDTSTTVRDIIQLHLLGEPDEFGTGMIPAEYIIGTTPKRNVPDAIETITVKHISGGNSFITLKTYEQGRKAWQGTAVDIVWIDEECPHDVYTEALTRTITTKGILFMTFTPLSGLTQLILTFKKAVKEGSSSKCIITTTWDDVPHIPEADKKAKYEAYQPHERRARSKGEPTLGAGAIYPIDIDEVLISDFDLPKHWPRCYALDVGWKITAAVWLAWDRESDTVYLYSEHYKGEAEPAIHAEAIKRRGEWIPGVIDPAARGRSQVDGTRLMQKYAGDPLSRDPAEKKGLGLILTKADNSIESGIQEVWERFSTGRLRIFRSCKNIQEELPVYHRDEKGKIKDTPDHALDCLRYGIMSGLKVAKTHVPKEIRRVANVIRPEAWT